MPDAISVQSLSTVSPSDANALATMAQAMERMAIMMRQATQALNTVDIRVEHKLNDFEAKIQTEILNPIQERMGTIEAKQRDSILITPGQRQQIREAVALKAVQMGKEHIHYSRMYGRLHREFGIPSYEYLRLVDLPQAMKYIASYDGHRTTWNTN